MRSPLLMLIPAVLMAQRSALPPQEAFDRELKKNRLGTWLVLEDEGAAWGATIRAALDDDALVTLNLPLKVVSGGKKPDALAATLRDRYGWAKGAHWALVDAKGFVLVERSTQPTVPGLVSATEQAGVKSRTQELEEFLKQNPDHLEAQGALLKELVNIANRRTRKALGNLPEKLVGAQPVPTEPPRQLDAEADLKIWSTVVLRLGQLLQGAWREAAVYPAVAIMASTAEHSPSMAALLTHYKGDMEDALRRRPTGPELWYLWLAASSKCGGWSLASLLQSLQPLPGIVPGEWPPAMALNEFVKDAKGRGDWSAIRGVLEPRLENLRTDGFRASGEGLWNSVISPLLEALVSLGDIPAADQLIGDSMSLDSWSGLPGQARDLATRLNRPDLAARWGALTPKGR
jgi:hypothetical protein